MPVVLKILLTIAALSLVAIVLFEIWQFPD